MALGHIDLYSPKYFAMCGIGGILSCGITHTALTPLDLVKCNCQANPEQFKNTFQGFRHIISGAATEQGFNSGIRGIAKGWGPTLAGYSVQGLGKFGLYELFKHGFTVVLGKETANKDGIKDLTYVLSSASAEFFADIGLCPFEAVKVRIQTRPDFARGLLDGLPKIAAQEGIGSLYAGLGPLWARQIPYTVIKFFAFEKIATAIYGMAPKPKHEMNTAEQMGVTFLAGYIAGVLCGAVSHPADTMVSKINKLQMEGSIGQKMNVIYKGTAEAPGIGFSGLWKGFAPRVVMIGTLTGLQWFIYGAFKAYVGLPVPGDVAKPDKAAVEQKAEK